MTDPLLDELKRYVEDNRLSTSELAKRLGLSPKTVEPWLAEGKSHSAPSAVNRERIKRLLHAQAQPTLEVPETFSYLKSASPAEPQANEGQPMHAPIQESSGKTIREPVQLDIELEPLETQVIDTLDFQRLRHIKQLGSASFVFPGATHTRFEHSLGTLGAAQRMMDSVIRKPESGVDIPPEVRTLVRMCALLHDITHVPFGHILEDEGFLYPRHDNPDSKRWHRFLGPSSEIGKILGPRLQQQVLLYLQTPRERIEELDYPYVVDIVGNTVCADLVDYLERDTKYTGLRETFDPRFLRSLVITPDRRVNGDGSLGHSRLALSLLRQDRVRRDVISEVMHLLRLRYSLAEKVYYHHAKVIASAMIIEAVQAALIAKPEEFSEESLCDLPFGDDELLVKLRDSGVPIAAKLASKLGRRALYKPVYMLTYEPPDAENRSGEKKQSIIDGFRDDHRRRFELERNLEKWNRLPEGSIIVYCPTEKMNLKVVETLCLWHQGRVKRLLDIPGVKSQAAHINGEHQRLWKLYVFLERGLEGERRIMHNVASDCYHRFGLSNCIQELAQVDKPPLERYIETWAELHPHLKVTTVEKNQIIELRSIYQTRDTTATPSFQELETDLKDLRQRE